MPKKIMPKNLAIKKIMIAITAFCILIVCVSLLFLLNKKSSVFVMDNDIAQDISKKNNAEERDIAEEKNIQEANQQAVQDAEQQTVQPVRSVSNEDHFLGDLEAPVQFIVYGDFDSPFCSEFYNTVKQALGEFSDSVVVAFRHVPLRMHSNALSAALASECAAEQGKFWEMHDKLFENDKESKLNIEQYKKNADDIGLSEAQFNECMETEKYKDKIYEQTREAKTFGVIGAPKSFINGEPVPGAYPFEDFIRANGDKEDGIKSIIERHLED